MARKRKHDATTTTEFSLPPQLTARNAMLATVDRMDGARVVRDTAVVAPPLSTAPKDFAGVRDLLGDTAADALDASQEVYEHYIQAPKSKKADRKAGEFVTTVHDEVLIQWLTMGHREAFLLELLRLDGWRGTSKTTCPTCPPDQENAPSVRCDECFGGEATCVQCCLEAHAQLPFHRIKRWDGNHFARTSLQDLGLVVEVGHPHGEKCINPAPSPRSFAVMHTNGFHHVTLQFCQCHLAHRAGSRFEQLLRAELFPATTTDPTTCCTFRMLEHFHLLTLQSKITAYDYYKTLEKLTDHTKLTVGFDRLKPFLRMVREWRHLKMLKRAGRGHHHNGVQTTAPGELCVVCPACPRPGFNIPSNWDTISDDLRFIYTMIIAFDANFRLRRRAVSNESCDPALGSGWSYFVEDKKYRDFILQHVDEEEISTCTGFAALLQSLSKYAKGYATTGVGMAIDARHGFVLGNGVGDLQKGERYCNLDYVYASAFALMPGVKWQVLSYDIACQWAVHLAPRLNALPSHVRIEIPTSGEIRYAIPKNHIKAHMEKDHNKFSLNLIHGVGRTDGEEIERNWARINAASYSTREMGPGSRHDTLEDHFGFANWEKYLGLGVTLKRRLKDATVEKVTHDRIYDDFCKELRPENVVEWIRTAIAWSKDFTQTDPYYITPSGLTEAEVRAQLLEKEEDAYMVGADSVHTISPCGMLIALMNIEDQQRRFRARFPKNANNTPLQTAEVLEKRRALRRRIDNLRITQAIYMPLVPELLSRQSSHGTPRDRNTDVPEGQPLLFPSQLTCDDLDRCSPGIAEIEEQLREGQMRDALDKLRLYLHIKTRLLNFKDRNVRHQGPNTRARHKIDSNESKIRLSVEKYRTARSAKLAIAGTGDWEGQWRVLHDHDVRTMHHASADYIPGLTDNNRSSPSTSVAQESEGRRRPSWIWVSADTAADGQEQPLVDFADALRVEFLKSRARCHRFTEEIQLVQEEQKRTLISLEKNALTWEGRMSISHVKCPILKDGLIAYAAKQADVQRSLAASFKRTWMTPILEVPCAERLDEGYEPQNTSVVQRSQHSADDDDDRQFHGVVSDESDGELLDDDDSDSD